MKQIVVPLEFLSVMTEMEAIALCWIMQSPKEDGWHPCTSKDMQKSLRMHERKQGRVFAALHDKGILKLSKTGFPAYRIVKVNKAALKRLLGGKNGRRVRSSKSGKKRSAGRTQRVSA